jgi:hypothetical protein
LHTAVERGHPLRRLAPCSPTRRPPSKASSQSCHQTRVSKQEDTTFESCDMDTTTLDPAGACALCRAGSCCRAQPAVCQVSLLASVVNGVGQGAARACHELHVASHFEGTRGKRPLHASCHQAVNAGNELIACPCASCTQMFWLEWLYGRPWLRSSCRCSGRQVLACAPLVYMCAATRACVYGWSVLLPHKMPHALVPVCSCTAPLPTT